MKIVFMGTPEFAVPSLIKLHEAAHKIVSVVTAPDKPVGRGQKVHFTPVKQAATELNIPVLQPTDLTSTDFIESVEKLNADLFVVVAFRILPPEVFTIPPNGTVNLHSSLLPKYRGAAPINWAIINGERETGVTTIFIEKQIDAGEIILQRKVEIGEDETAGELHDRLATLGAEVLLATIDAIERGDAPRKPQRGEATRAPKLTKELGEIDWSKPNEDIRNLIRGLAPRPGAYTYLNGKLLKIYRAQLDAGNTTAESGEITAADAKHGSFKVQTGKGVLQILDVQPEGKRRMSSQDFLKGYQVQPGDKLGKA